MTVVFKGGSSGNRQDGLPPVPSSGSAQPVLDTATRGSVASSIHMQSDTARPQRHGQHATADFMPTGATIPSGSTDVAEPLSPPGMDASSPMFKGVKDGVA